MEKRKVAVIGYGNVGRFAVEAIKASPDLMLGGVVRRGGKDGRETPPELLDTPIVAHIKELTGVAVAVLAVPTRMVPQYAEECLELGINTVDSYDIHGEELVNLRRKLGAIASKNNSVAILSAGWDPGTDSLLRGMMELMAPRGLTYTNFGPGMSMGHTVVVKGIAGVKDALSMTMPQGGGIHSRMVYVELEEGADFSTVETTILQDPYFVNDDTHIKQVDSVKELIDWGHGVSMERKGVSGFTHNQLFKYEMRINNPALTSQVMVAAARASFKQQPGAYTMMEVPVIDYLPGDKEDLICRLV